MVDFGGTSAIMGGVAVQPSDTLYVVKGGTIDKEDQIRGYISNDRSKPIPRYYYMALLFKKEIHSKRSLLDGAYRHSEINKVS